LYDWGVAFEEPVVLPVVAVAESDALALTVYPNPTHTAFHVRLSESLASIQSLQLADLSCFPRFVGQIVRVRDFSELRGIFN
jgi:vancomycin permeability regulator SanA